MWPRGWVEAYLYCSMTAALEGGWMVSSTPRPHFTPGKDPVPILQEAGWAPGRKNSLPPGFDSGPSSPKSVAIPTEIPGPLVRTRNGGEVLSYKITVIFLSLSVPLSTSVSYSRSRPFYVLYITPETNRTSLQFNPSRRRDRSSSEV